jgi:PEP-CTERM motif
MKKAIVLAIIGVAAAAATSSYGQGAIKLDNYDTYGPNVNYGAGSDGAVGTGVNSSYTMGVYYWNAVGDHTGGTASDPTGIALPGSLGSFLLGSGANSTAQFDSGTAAGYLGQAIGGGAFNIPTSDVNGGQVWTLMIVAYEGASYNTAQYRGHSGAFNLTTSAASSPTTVLTGTAMPGFSVFAVAVPEPTTMALGGLGLASLLLFRRKQA